MRRSLGILVAFSLALLAGPSLSAPAWAAQEQSYIEQYTDYSHVRIVRLSLIEGDVQIYRTETGQWEPAVANMPIRHGYALATGAGFAEVEFESGATARLAQYTEVDFSELALADGARLTRMDLSRGTATFYAHLARNDIFSVSTPHLDARAHNKASFRLDVDQRETQVRVHSGDVRVETSAGSYRVTKNRMLTFGADAGEPLLARAPRADEWDRWVSDRATVLHRGSGYSSGYVNAPFRYGLADLAHYGSWIYASSYGNCWQPWGVGSAWSPFLSGRWMYLRGVGWNWVSYEPWGWVPYHYGSWAHTNYGWCWVPGSSWGFHPGRVHWLRFGNHFGWVPWCPNDRFGVTPRNLQHGAVVNTKKGIAGVIGNLKLKPGDADKPVILDRPPLGSGDGPRGRPGIAGVLEKQGGGASANTGAGTDRGGIGGVVSRPRPGTGGGSDIVRDPQTGTFVNNPARPPRPAAPAQAGTPRDPAAPGPRGIGGVAGSRPSPPARPAPSTGIGRPQPDRPASGIGGVVRPPSRPAAPPASPSSSARPGGVPSRPSSADAPRPSSPPPASPGIGGAVRPPGGGASAPQPASPPSSPSSAGSSSSSGISGVVKPNKPN